MARSALLIGNITHARNEWDELSSLLELKEYKTGSRDEFLSKLKSGDFNDTFVVYRSNESTGVTGPFDKELVDLLPSSVKYITHNGAGYDNIDVKACTARGIQISSTPIAVNDATADIAIFLMLGALRRITVPFNAVRKGEWRGKAFGLGHDPKNKVLGILGMGGIGKAVAERAAAFGMKIQYHNRNPLPADKAGNAKYVSFDDLIKTSDVLSLNLALNPSTKHIISTAQFDMMKDGVVIVNTARGPIIDEAALVKAIQSEKVFSAGLDVFEEEPKIHPELISDDRVVLLPHIGTATWETQKDMELLVLENLRSAVEKGELVTLIPEQSNFGGPDRRSSDNGLVQKLVCPRLGSSADLFATGIYGVVKVVVTGLALAFMTGQLGRKWSLIIGALGQAFAMIYIGINRAVNPVVKGAPLNGNSIFAIISVYLFVVFLQHRMGDLSPSS
ncbi:D-3-phosphoglycerate dehydrogenase, variant, partial [Aureobasidium sp. EXF-3399]